MKFKRNKAQVAPERSVLLVGGPFDARTLYNPLPAVGETVLMSIDHGDQHVYLCETDGTASYTGVVTEADRVLLFDTRISEPASDPTK